MKKSKKRIKNFKISHKNEQGNKKIVEVIVLLGVLLGIFLVMAITFGSATRYEYYNPTRTTNDNFNNDSWNSQVFKVGINGTNESFQLKGISLVIYGQPTNEFNLTVGIRATNASGKPIGIDLTNATINGTTIPIAYTWTNFSFAGHEYLLLQNTEYAIVARTNLGGAGIGIGMGGAGLGYYGGNKSISTDAGNSWTVDGANDFLFEVWGIVYGAGTPTLTLSIPSNNTLFSKSVTFNCSATDEISQMLNLTLIVNGIVNNTVTNETANVNLSLQSTQDFSYGNYNWSCIGVNSAGNIGSIDTRVFKVGEWMEEKRVYNSSAYETASETFIVNITANGSQTLSANLIYDGDSYSTTKTGDNYNALFSKTLDIPTGLGNNTFYWNISYGSSITNTSSNLQDVFETRYSICNATYPVPFLNVSFRDEDDSSRINATIPSSSFVYYLGSGSVNKTYTYSYNIQEWNYTFCATPNRTFYVLPYIQYNNEEESYPQRIWSPAIQTYTNSLTQQILYLLSSSDGIYVTLQVVNSADSVIEGVEVEVTREVDGVDTVVGTGTTGADGLVTFWLNPDFSHTFTFTKEGYTTYTTSFTPTQSSYTITLVGTTSPTGYDYTKGISYSINPKSGELYNGTTYNFNYTLSSDYYTVTEFGFVLKLSNGTILQSTSDSSNGGFVNLNQNTGNYSRIVMNYYYVVNSTYINYTTYWNVLNTDNTEWSIKHFFTDLNAYLDSGLFGIDNFGRYLIIFLVLFISVGVVSFKFGLTSPLSISSMIFAIVFFFDVVVELLPTPIRAIPHSLTYLSLLILIVLIIKEAQT